MTADPARLTTCARMFLCSGVLRRARGRSSRWPVLYRETGLVYVLCPAPAGTSF